MTGIRGRHPDLVIYDEARDSEALGTLARLIVGGDGPHDRAPFTHEWGAADPVEIGDGEWTEAPQGAPLTVQCGRRNGKTTQASGVLTPDIVKAAFDDLWYRRIPAPPDDIAIEAATWTAHHRPTA
jgi:hypothetical protein